MAVTSTSRALGSRGNEVSAQLPTLLRGVYYEQWRPSTVPTKERDKNTFVARIESGATLSELETAAAWAAGADEVLGEEREPLTGATAEVYDILIADEEFGEEA